MTRYLQQWRSGQKWLSLSLFLLILHPSFGQDRLVDSLITLTQSDIPAKEKVDIYNQLAYRYLVYDSAETARYGGEAIKLADEINYPEGKSDALYAIGWVTMVFGHNQKAIELFNEVVTISENAGYTKGQSNGFNGLGDAYRNRGDYAKALEYHLQALKMKEKLGDQSRIASSLNNIGNIYFLQNDYNRALDYYQRALDIRKELDNPAQLAVSYNNMGIVAKANKDFNKALEYYEKCLNLNSLTGDVSALAKTYHNMAVVYSDEMQDYHKASENFFKVIDSYRTMGDEASMTYPLLGLAEMYAKLKDWRAAKSYVTKAIAYSEEAELMDNLSLGNGLLAEVESNLGNYKEAYDASVRYHELGNELKNDEQTRALTLLEAEYNFQKERDSTELANEKEKLIIHQQLQEERTKQYAAIAGAAILLVLLFIVYRYSRLKKKANDKLLQKNQQIEKQKAELEKVNATKNRFFSIISHDLRNPLASLQGITSLLDPKILSESDLEKTQKEISRRIDGIGNVMVNLLDWAKEQMEGEVREPKAFELQKLFDEMIKLYEPTGEQKEITIKKAFEENIIPFADPNQVRVVLRNLVGNALKFTRKNGTIELDGKIEGNDRAIIMVRDSGIGMDAKRQESLFSINTVSSPGTSGEKGVGLGLMLAKEYVEKNKGEIWVESEPNKGTTFFFSLPLAS